MELINTGSTRVVILTTNYAIKFPRCCTKVDNKFYGRVVSLLSGWISNRHEYKWSNANVYDFLCKVEYSFLFSFIIVMKRAKPLTREQFYNLKQYDFIYEHKLDSYGIVDNKIVVIDYGNNA